MKIKLNLNLVVNTIFIGCIVFFIALLLGSLYFTKISNFMRQTTPANDVYKWVGSDLNPIDATIPDSLNHLEYNNKKDSVRIIRSLKDGDYPIGSSVSEANLLSTSQNLYCDTCSLKWFYNRVFKSDTNTNIRYYIKLSGWKVKQAMWADNDIDSVRYYVKSDQAYLRKTIEIPDKAGNPKLHVRSIVDVPVKFRYSQRDQCLMIPTSKSTETIVYIVLLVTGILFALYVLYLISGFLNFVLDLSKGLAFTNKNVIRLRLIAISLLAYPIIILLLNFLLRLIFHAYFTSDVILNSDIWSSSWKIIIAGLIFLALWKAFKQGKQIKEEQDLTV